MSRPALPAPPVRLGPARRVALVTILAVLFLAVPMLPSRSQTAEPFGQAGYLAPEGSLWARWRKLRDGIAADQAVLEACRATRHRCTASARRFDAIVAAALPLAPRERLDLVNRAVNGMVSWRDDGAGHHATDVWQSPLTSLASGHGDCMDIVAAKYVLLREARTPDQGLRIMIVWDLSVRRHHAVLAARSDGDWLVLDSRSDTIARDADDHGYLPLFAINNAGVKQFHPPPPPGGFRLRDHLRDRSLPDHLPCPAPGS